MSAKLIEMGQITTVGLDGEKSEYKMALLIEFDNRDDIRKAIAEGTCEFSFGEPETISSTQVGSINMNEIQQD